MYILIVDCCKMLFRAVFSYKFDIRESMGEKKSLTYVDNNQFFYTGIPGYFY